MPIMSKHSVTVSEHIRHHILTGRLLGTDYESLKRTQWSDRFEKLMRNRLIMGALRYGLNFMGVDKPNWNRMARIASDVELYMKTGNEEALVDIANHAMLEFEEGNHPLRHFGSSDNDDNHVKISYRGKKIVGDGPFKFSIRQKVGVVNAKALIALADKLRKSYKGEEK